MLPILKVCHQHIIRFHPKCHERRVVKDSILNIVEDGASINYQLSGSREQIDEQQRGPSSQFTSLSRGENMSHAAKLRNFMSPQLRTRGKKWDEAEKKLENGIEAKMHFNCKDKRYCVQFIHDHPLDEQKRGGESI